MQDNNASNFQVFPLEILDEIASWLESKFDLLRFALASKALFDLISQTHIPYRELQFRSDDVGWHRMLEHPERTRNVFSLRIDVPWVGSGRENLEDVRRALSLMVRLRCVDLRVDSRLNVAGYVETPIDGDSDEEASDYNDEPDPDWANFYQPFWSILETCTCLSTLNIQFSHNPYPDEAVDGMQQVFNFLLCRPTVFSNDI